MPDWKPRGCFLGARPPGQERSRTFLLQSLAGGTDTRVSHHGAPGLPLGRQSSGVGGAPVNPGAQPETPTLRGQEGFVFPPDSAAKPRVLVTPAFSFTSSKPSPSRLSQTAQAALSVLKFGHRGLSVSHAIHALLWSGRAGGRVTVGRSGPCRPIAEGNRRLTCCHGLLPGLGSGPGGPPWPPAACAQGDLTPCGTDTRPGQGKEDPPPTTPCCPGDPQGGQRTAPIRPRTAALQAQEPQVALMGREGPWSCGFCTSLVMVGFIR